MKLVTELANEAIEAIRQIKALDAKQGGVVTLSELIAFASYYEIKHGNFNVVRFVDELHPNK